MTSKLLRILSREQYEGEQLVQKLKRDYAPDTSDETNAEFEAAC